MGVVKRQGIKQSIVNYAGVFLAFFSTIFVYSLNTELYGAAGLIDTTKYAWEFSRFGFTLFVQRADHVSI
jgi:hypothetical protein